MSQSYHPPPCLGELAAAAKKPAAGPPGCDFAEAQVWEKLGGGWCSIYGCYCEHGLSVEWHDFSCEIARDWARSFHPGSVEVCLNLSGHARMCCDEQSVTLGPMTVGLYAAASAGADQKLSAWRLPGERHQFLTVEYSPDFMRRHLAHCETALHPVIRSAMRPRGGGGRFAPTVPLTQKLRKRITELRQCPHSGHPANVWYQAKALELVSELFFNRPECAEPVSSRSVETSRRRVARAIEVLGQRLADPPPLEELGRIVGCSPFYLSRTFSRQMGMTIPQYLRQIRMERAADLLKSGKFNVTEAALEVGYNSLSHFSHAFCEVIGCCPGLYPLGVARPVPGTSPRAVSVAQPAAEAAAQRSDNK